MFVINGYVHRMLLLVGFLFALHVSAIAAADWLENFEDAKKQAKEEGKAILANFTGSDWCPYCIKLDKEVLATEEFESWAKDKVVLLEVDFPRSKSQKSDIKKQNSELSAKYEISGYPAVVFMTAEGEKLGQTGYTGQAPKDWVSSADRYIDPYLAKRAKEKKAADEAAKMMEEEKRKAEEARVMAKREELKKDGYREWTDQLGRKVFAKYVATAGGVVGLLGENGAKIRVKESDFSQEDQEFLKKQK